MKNLKLYILSILMIGSYGLFPNTVTFTPTCVVTTSVLPINGALDCFSFYALSASTGDLDSYYSWDFGDGSPIEFGKKLNHCYSPVQVGTSPLTTAVLSYSNPISNCIVVQTNTINVSEVSNSCPQFSPSSFVLSGLTATLNIGSLIPEMQFLYTYGDGTSSSNNIHSYDTCGNYIIDVASWDMNFPNKVCHNFISINIACVSTYTCFPIPAYSITGSVVAVDLGSSIPEMQFLFNYGDGTEFSSNPTHSYAACGTYTIDMASWDMNTPNNVCHTYIIVNISCDSNTSIKKYSLLSKVYLYPNPSENILNIISEMPIKCVKIIDILGKELMTESEVNREELKLDLTNLPNGTYFSKMIVENKTEYYIRFIKIE